MDSTWNLYVHPVGCIDWTEESYKHLLKVNEPTEIAGMLQLLAGKQDKVSGAYLCLMREDIKPVYESPLNQKGGALSIRTNADNAAHLWSLCVANMVSNTLLIPTVDQKIVNGIIITPKKGNMIIQIWFREKVDASVIHPMIPVSVGTILYRPHYERI
jgi:hypothetical protein